MKRRHGATGSSERAREEPNADFVTGLKGRTSNVQRRDQNATVSSERRFDLEERLLEYAVRIIRLVDALPGTREGRHVADHLLRCGTSPLANHGELQGAESRKDFIHKLGICLKEIREARHWLRLVHRVPFLAPSKIGLLVGETGALIKIFFLSIRTAEKNKG